MSLLAPLFLLGLGLLALPVWLHRLQTDDPKRETFASTMFLEATQDRVHVRRQLQHLLLLLLRLLFLALLVFAFARPVLQSDALRILAANDQMHIVVIDTSGSMLSSSVFEAAKSEAKELIESAGPEDGVRLFSFGTELAELGGGSSLNAGDASSLELSTDRSELLRVLDNLEPMPVAGDLGDLMSGLSRLDWSQPLDYQVALISDLQKTSLADRYADMIPDLPADAEVSFSIHPVAAESVGNWLIDSVREEDQGVRLTVRGIGTPEQELELGVQLNQGVRQSFQLSVPESGRASLFIPLSGYEPGVNTLEVEITADDALAQDNRYHLVIDREPPEPLLLLTSNPFGLATTYLSAVMSSLGSEQSRSRAYKIEPQSLAEFDERTLPRYSWLLIDDIGAISPSLANALGEYVESGGALMAGAGELASGRETLPLFGQAIQSGELGTDSRTLAVASVDRSHPMLNGLEGWSELRVSRYLSIDLLPGDRTLVGMENGAPLLVEQRRGRGKQLLMTSALDNQWNNLPVKPLYVSLMSRAASYLSGSDSLRLQYLGGESIGFNQESGGAGQLLDPDGQAVLALGSTNRTSAHRLDKLGFYELFTANRSAKIGVNLPAAESDLTPMDAEEIAGWTAMLADRGAASIGVDADGSVEDASAETGLVQNQQNQRNLWFGLLCAAALLLFGESLFANAQISARTNQMRRPNAAA